MTLNEISNPNDNNQDNNPLELTSYDKLKHLARYHWCEGRFQAKEFAKYINGMVIILHENNPDWSINRIAKQMWIDFQDLEGFSKSTIYNYLDDYNKRLLKPTGRPKKKNYKDEFQALETNVPEDSSTEREKRLIQYLKAARKDFEDQDKALEQLKQENKQLKEDKANLDPEHLKKISDLKDIEFEHNEKLLEKNREIEGLKEILKDKDSQIEDLGYELDKASVNIKSVIELQQNEPVTENQRTVTRKYQLQHKDQTIPLICIFDYDTKSFTISVDE